MGDPHFSGWATKAGLECSDGRTITENAFKHQDQTQVPLVWQHGHDSVENILGYAVLEHRDGGVYCYGYFNDTPAGQHARSMVEHGDVKSLSIWANKLVERSKQVLHGAIREVSLVLSGANPGAFIENVSIRHSDGDVIDLEDEAIIYSDIPLDEVVSHSENEPENNEEEEEEEEETPGGPETPTEPVVQHADDGKTIGDVYDAFSKEQKDVVHYLIGDAVQNAISEVQHSDTNEDTLTHQEGSDMSRNVFSQNGTAVETPTLSHDQLKQINEDAQKIGSYKEAFLAHAQEYGITDIDVLFPDAQSVTSQPELIARRTEWVKGVIDGAKHSPFSRIKSLAADLTAEEARAKGYVKGSLKKEEVVKLLKRVTTPTTVYKKQKLDRDDIVDITTLDVVAWLKWEMRFMLEEELARAILIGDGREVDHEDKIDEDHLRPIAFDDDMYAHKVTIPSNTAAEGMIEAIIRARKNYKGTGRPAFYTTDDVITDLLLIKNKIGNYVYEDEAALASKLRVSSLIAVEVMEDEPDIIGIMVNIADYTIGADRGGQMSMFEDFDIDYNQHKYLIETRVSGALTKPKSAVVVRRASGTSVVPPTPAFDAETNTITVPNQAGVAYYDVTDVMSETALADGATVVITETTEVEARPEAGYSFPHGTDADWTFVYTP